MTPTRSFFDINIAYLSAPALHLEVDLHVPLSLSHAHPCAVGLTITSLTIDVLRLIDGIVDRFRDGLGRIDARSIMARTADLT